MKHEHTLEVSLSPQLQEAVGQTQESFRENKRALLFGLSGIVIGAVGMRIFARPSVTQIVVIQSPVPTD